MRRIAGVDVGETTMIFLEEHRFGGPAPRDCCMLRDCDKLTF